MGSGSTMRRHEIKVTFVFPCMFDKFRLGNLSDLPITFKLIPNFTMTSCFASVVSQINKGLNM